MKPSRLAIILLGLTILASALFWMTSSSKTKGAMSGDHLKSDTVMVPAPVVHARDLILVEFFAGY
jgi:hypothetical protein